MLSSLFAWATASTKALYCGRGPARKTKRRENKVALLPEVSYVEQDGYFNNLGESIRQLSDNFCTSLSQS